MLFAIKVGHTTHEGNFIKNKIGKIIRNDYIPRYYPYAITYDNIPADIFDKKINNINVILFKRDDIEYWSKNKEELELILQTNKFNI